MAISKEICVKKAGLADVPALVPLFVAYRSFYGVSAPVDTVQNYLAARLQTGQSVVLLAEQAGQACGFSQLYPSWCSLTLAPYYILFDLYVSSDHRRQGVARQLLKAAVAEGQAQQMDRLELATGVDNAGAQALYRALGWQQDCEFLHFGLPLSAAATALPGKSGL